MKKAKIFRADERNLGGRKVITEQMYNHHNVLMNIKPVIKIEEPRPHVNANSESKN